MARIAVTLASFVRHANRKIRTEYAALEQRAAQTHELEERLAAADRELAQAREMKNALATALGGEATTSPAPTEKNNKPKTARREKRRFTMTPKQRRARKAQGIYIGFIRHWKNQTDVRRVKSFQHKEGYGSALKEIARLRAAG